MPDIQYPYQRELLIYLPVAYFFLGIIMQLVIRNTSGLWKSAVAPIIITPIIILGVFRTDPSMLSFTFSYVLLSAFGAMIVWGISGTMKSWKK